MSPDGQFYEFWLTTKNTGSSEEHRGRRAALNADMRHRVSEMMEIIWELSFKSVATNASSSSAASCSRFTCTATAPPQSLTSHVDRHNISRQREHAGMRYVCHTGRARMAHGACRQGTHAAPAKTHPGQYSRGSWIAHASFPTPLCQTTSTTGPQSRRGCG